MNIWFKKILIAGTLLYFVPFLVSAQQVNLPVSLENELNVSISPEHPRANQKVFVSLSLYTNDLNSANINWFLNGKKILEGVGKTNTSFKMGQTGIETKIVIEITLLNGVSFSKNISLTPTDVDLVWEADSYTPPFYKGKSLFAKQGYLKVVAIPNFFKNGELVPAENLIYEWSDGVKSYQNQSGFGKNTLLINGSILGREESIDVLVTDPESDLAANASIVINPVSPEIIFYENSPYYGEIFNSALQGDLSLKKEEIGILAAPYYFSNEKTNNLQYGWSLNGEAVEELNQSRTAVFKKPKDSSGSSEISLRIDNLNRVLQAADNSLLISFKK